MLHIAKEGGYHDEEEVKAKMESRRGRVLPLPEMERVEMAALLNRRRQLIAMLTAEQNRYGTALDRLKEGDCRAYRLAGGGCRSCGGGTGSAPGQAP